MTPIPWRDQATLIRTSGASIHEGGRVIVAEAPLHRLIELVDGFAADELRRHYITLPDRGVAPFRYDGDAIRGLLGRLDRPGVIESLQARAGAPPLAVR